MTHKNKVGRPEVPEELKRDVYAGLNFTREEWRIVRDAIKISGLDNSKWIRRACLCEAKRDIMKTYRA